MKSTDTDYTIYKSLESLRNQNVYFKLPTSSVQIAELQESSMLFFSEKEMLVFAKCHVDGRLNDCSVGGRGTQNGKKKDFCLALTKDLCYIESIPSVNRGSDWKTLHCLWTIAACHRWGKSEVWIIKTLQENVKVSITFTSECGLGCKSIAPAGTADGKGRRPYGFRMNMGWP